MTDTMSRRLATFERDIQSTLFAFGVPRTGLEKDDCASILRTAVWELLRVRNVSRSYVRRAIKNRMVDLFRRAREPRRSRMDVERISHEPWRQVDLRLDVQKLLDSLDPSEVQILSSLVVRGRQETQDELGLSAATLYRKLARARVHSRAVLA